MVLVEPHGGDPFKICVTNRNQSRTCPSPNNSMFVSLTRTEVTCPPFACPNSPASRTAAIRRERSPSTRIVNCVRRFVSPSSVVSPDGQLLCRISHKKLDWYVHKGLGGDLHSAGMIPSGGEPRPLHGASVLRAEVYGCRRRFRDSSHSEQFHAIVSDGQQVCRVRQDEGLRVPLHPPPQVPPISPREVEESQQSR